MAGFSVTAGGSGTISSSGDYAVSLGALSTLNIAGTAANPITVNLSSVSGVGALDVVNISNALVTYNGTAGISAVVAYKIGSGGTFTLASTVGVGVGTSIAFTGTNSRLVLGNAVNLSLLSSGISGFAPGSSIDVSALAASVSYVDGTGTNTGGTLNLLNSSGTVVQTISLSTGEYVSGDFRLTPDSNGGTIVDFGIHATNVTASPATGDLRAGNTVTFAVTMSAPVTISGGVPSLTLNDGGVATFNPGLSSGTNLVFNYTVAAGQNTPDLAVTGVSLNGATVSAAGGVPVDLSGAAVNPTGTLQVDTTAPTITSLTMTPSTAALNAGGTVAITLTTSEAVAVAGGAPTLTLSDGGVATYDPQASTNTSLVFRYTVLAGQNSADLSVNSINLGTATVTDGAGNPANLAGAVGNPAGVVIVDTVAPTVTSVTTTPGSGTLMAGQSVAFMVSTSEAVIVTGGSPTLTLNDGGTAIYDAAASTSNNLVFRHTVLAGQNSADLAVSSLNLNGASINDPAGNPLTLAGALTNPAGVLTVDTTAPTVSGVSINPSSTSLGLGGVAIITVTMSEAVTLAGGSPSLTLSDGGTATFDPSSSTQTSLVFRHTVLAGQNSPDLSIASVVMPTGSTITDAAGNAANLMGAVTNPTGILVVDTTAPMISSIATNPGSGALGIGGIVTFTLSTSEPVTVTGTPTLTLNDGGIASYTSTGSTPNSLNFTYTVGAGQDTADLAVTALALNGGTITDAVGNNADLSNAAGNPPGVLVVDTTAPVVTDVTASPGSANLGAGQVVLFTVSMSEGVFVDVTNGTPSLTLNDGGMASYVSGASSGSNLVFSHTVQTGQNSADLSVSAVNLNGSIIRDGVGNTANLAGAARNPLGTLVVDTIAPTVTGVTTNPGSGALAAGQTVTFTVATTEPVNVVGQPTLTLNDGGIAVYNPTLSTTTSLVFTHTVAAGQNAADLAVTGVNLGAGVSIADPAGNAADLTNAVTNPAGVLSVDTVAPTIGGLTTSSAAGPLGVGQTVTFTATASEPITVSGGTPTLLLNDGGTATYNPGASSLTTMVFNYTVQAGQNTTDLAVTSSSLNGATVTDSAGNAADLTGLAVNPAGTLVIDTTAPTVTGVTTNPASGTLHANDTVAITVTTSEAVTVVGGTPTLTLSDGGIATYVSGSSTPTSLVFTTIVQPGQNSADLAIIGVAQNGATVADAAGNAAGLTGAIGNPAGVLAVVTNGTSPTVSSVVTSPGSGDLTVGQPVTFTVTMSTPVIVAGGTPTLLLSDGGQAVFDATASNGSNLVFTHTVQPGQNTPDLAIQGINLNNATVTDGQGTSADLTGLVTNPTGVVIVDTTAPTLPTITASTSSGTAFLRAGQTVTITATPSEPVTLSGGVPTLTLNNGGVATYDPSSTSTSLVFKYTVQAGQQTGNLSISGIAMNGAALTDAAGNQGNLSQLLGNVPGALVVDTTSPTVGSVTTNPTAATIGAGQIVAITVTMTEPVTVAGGSPTLTLDDGGTATFNASASTATNLVFTYTVAPGQNTPDLTVTAVNLGGATISDNAGNNADLTGAATNPAGTLTVDTTPPTITAVTTLPGSGSLVPGQIVEIDLAVSEAVAVTGTTLSLSLSDGGTALYDPSNSTATKLAFTHTVQPGQTSADLTVTGVNLNGTTATDAAGNTADFTGAIANPPGLLVINGASTQVTGVTTNPGSGLVGANQTVTITLSTTTPVTISGGTPTLTLNDGGTAFYDAAASATAGAPVFIYTAAPGENTADLTITAVSLNSATASGTGGIPVDFSNAVTNPAGVLSVDTVAPTIGGLTTSSAAGPLGVGQTVTFTATASEPITVSGGTPTLLLNDGGTATYNPGASSLTTMVFNYTVQAGQNTTDLAVTSSSLNGATVTDSAGNAADLTGLAVNPAGTLVIDTTAPTVTGVTTNPASGTLHANDTVAITVTTSEAVTVVGGTPTLTLSDGGIATYVSGSSTPTSLVFTTIVQPGQNSADLAIIGVAQNGATVADAAGNAAGLTGAIGNPAGVLAVVTNGTSPTVSSVVTSPGSGDLTVGQPVTFTVTMSTPVIVAGGTPTLLLSDGGQAVFDATASNGSNLVFTHTVQPGQNTPDLAIQGINLNNATVTDGQGTSADLTGLVTNPTGVVIVDTTAPTLPTITASTSSGTAFLRAGQTVTITATPSEPVTLSGGVPTLTLNNGGVATYDPSSTSTSLVFKYTVQAGQQTGNLSISGIAMNGAALTDAAGNQGNLSQLLGNVPGALVVDTTSPTVGSVTTNPTAATIGAGQIVAITVTMTEPVTVAGGSPTLTLDDGGTATFNASASTATNLVFTYTVAPGQNTPDLTVTAVNLGGATISDNAGNNADLTGAATNPAGTLTVDTTPPTITRVTASAATTAVTVGDVVTFTVATSEPVTVTGGTPTLRLNDGGTAVYNAASSGPAALVFSYVVQPDENSADLAVNGLNLNGATVADAAGNVADLSGAAVNPDGILTVDTTPPHTAGVTIGTTNGGGTDGQPAVIHVTTTKPVTVTSGVPTLSLSNGGTATYDPASSNPTDLAFAYTPPPGQNASDLTIDRVNTNGATISDTSGNVLDLSEIAGRSAGSVTIAPSSNLGVYRFFDSNTGTHFFTADINEKNLLTTPTSGGYRPDLVEETNDFGAVDPNSSNPAKVQVFRFFDSIHGTHFFTANQAEATGIMDPKSSSFRSDLVYEPNATFYEHGTQQTGDVAVYRFFDTSFGTHFYTGNQAEFTALTTPGTASFRTDLVYEGVGFYAPAGTYK